ncbi:PorV/PorQ family protein [Flavobacterium gawalongense]|uniref:PorV/PorQ family protein n=1 Tax=Flavobacterium gawalongense TaxID=2594432 RepID=A0A553BZH3_9FLAO|nr:PorV/PorQ family protein [Flavobacterium gawalongense]TRX13598.1 PorV/PorQ family protein [Flavobacterium gawalongense]TRX15786.1 PorV/PorQ family protein [Flavobacterium gawalongense]TRX31624.1 PorV/PorQ family protein [Flavobacterium gawalongense]
MNIGVDAAALGMSNTVVASTDDVNSGYWNPAGLMHLEDHQVSLMHANYFANIAQYDYLAYASPIDDQSAWGISLIRFGVDDILNTTELIDSQGNIDYNRISLFSTADYGFTFSYARKLPVPGFQYGANAKVIRRIIGKFASSWGFGFDVGLQFKKNNWQFGLMLRDIITTYNVWNIDEEEYKKIANAVPGENQELPESTEITAPKAQLGIAKKFIIRYDYSILAAANMNMRFTKTNDLISTDFVSIDPAIGLEFGYTDLVFVRAGAGNFQNVEQLDSTEKVGFQPNIGLGFKYKGIQIDYALTDLGNQSTALYSNIFSVKVDLGLFRN